MAFHELTEIYVFYTNKYWKIDFNDTAPSQRSFEGSNHFQNFGKISPPQRPPFSHVSLNGGCSLEVLNWSFVIYQKVGTRIMQLHYSLLPIRENHYGRRCRKWCGGAKWRTSVIHRDKLYISGLNSQTFSTASYASVQNGVQIKMLVNHTKNITLRFLIITTKWSS